MPAVNGIFYIYYEKYLPQMSLAWKKFYNLGPLSSSFEARFNTEKLASPQHPFVGNAFIKKNKKKQ